MNYYVYGLYESEDAKFPFYIGKGCGKRMYKHFMESVKSHNPHKERTIQKAKREGKNPEARIIKDKLPEEKAYNIEYLLINIHYENLTNITRSWGNGVGSEQVSGEKNPMYGKTRTFSEETKQKMGKAFRGKNLSEEHKEKISKSHKGKTHNQEARKKMRKKAEGRYTLEWFIDRYGEEKGRQKYKEKSRRTSKKNSGESSPHAKLKRREASEIKWLAKNSDKTYKQIGQKYDVTKSAVSSIKLEKNWNHVESKKPNEKIWKNNN